MDNSQLAQMNKTQMQLPYLSAQFWSSCHGVHYVMMWMEPWWRRSWRMEYNSCVLANHVQHDKDQIAGKFCCQICWIQDPIVCILILHTPKLGYIKHQKILVFQPSDSCKLIQGVVEVGPTINIWSSCLTFKPSAFTFLSLMTIQRASSIWCCILN